MSAINSQGVYLPVPQTISDTETEEEVHNTNNSADFRSPTKNKRNRLISRHYNLLSNHEDISANGSSNLNNPVVNITKKKISPLRKYCFILSLLLCFVTVAVFIWVLPCSENLTCPAANVDISKSSWEKKYYGIELLGPITIVKGLEGHSKNIIFIYHSDIIQSNAQTKQEGIPKSGGIVAIVANNGLVAYYIPTKNLPTDIDCSLIDVNLDGITDCIVRGENGLLVTFDPIAGTIYWHAQIYNSSSIITKIDFPLILPDLNHDGINDLVVSGWLSGSHKSIIIISGKTGHEIGVPVSINCSTVPSYYSCQGTDTLKEVLDLPQLYKKATNETLVVASRFSFKQHQFVEIRKEQRTDYSIDGRKLVVDNKGQCPFDCKVDVYLYDERNGNNLTWSHSGTSMYGMVPTKLSFQSTLSNIRSLKGHTNGFILKFWHWSNNRNQNTDRKKFDSVLNLWNDVTVKKHAWNIKDSRSKRNVAFNSASLSVQFLTERIVLITFNSTNVRIVNASQSEIIQLCVRNKNSNVCQPDLDFQRNSVVIVDLDNDSSQELISYLSTFVRVDESSDSWDLESTVKVIQLEAELPKLYEAVSRY